MNRHCSECHALLVKDSVAIRLCYELAGSWFCEDHKPGSFCQTPAMNKFYEGNSILLSPAMRKVFIASQRPEHYRHGKLSDVDVAEDWDMPPWLCHALKHIRRHKWKNGVEDLRKAVDEINYQIEAIEAQQEDKADD